MITTEKKPCLKKITSKDRPRKESGQDEVKVGIKSSDGRTPSPVVPHHPRNDKTPSPTGVTKQELKSSFSISKTIFAKTREPEVAPRIGSPKSKLETDNQTEPKKILKYKKSISFDTPKYMVLPTFKKGTLTSANIEKTWSTRDFKDKISSEKTMKNASIVGIKRPTPSATPRSSMKDARKKMRQTENMLTTNSNNFNTRSTIKFKVADPRVGLNNSSDRNNNQVNEDGDEEPEEDDEGGEATGVNEGKETSEAETEITDDPDAEPQDKENDEEKVEQELEDDKGEEKEEEESKEESKEEDEEIVKGVPSVKSEKKLLIKPSVSREKKGVTKSIEFKVEENKNFINLIEGLKIDLVDPSGHFIRILNVSEMEIDIKNRILIQTYDDSPYTVYKFPNEPVLVLPGTPVTVWAEGADGKDDRTNFNFIFRNQKFWSFDPELTKTILTDMNDTALSYLTTPKAQVSKKGKGPMTKVSSAAGPDGGLGPSVGGKCGCDSIDSLVITDKSLLTTKFGKDKTASQKKTRVCELKTFDLSTLCDDFDTRDKDGLRSCILCSCFAKKPIRQIEITCEDDGDTFGDNLSKTEETGTDTEDACRRTCRKMAKRRNKDDKLLDDEEASNSSAKAWGKPDFDYSGGKETGNSTKRKTGERKYELNDDFCDEFGERSKYEKTETVKDGRMTAEECETPGNNFDKFNKFMKDMCDEFDLDIMKKKDEKTETGRAGETDSCSNLCNRNKIRGGGGGVGWKEGSCTDVCKRGGERRTEEVSKEKEVRKYEEVMSSNKMSQPVQDNQVIRDLCESIKGYDKTSSGSKERKVYSDRDDDKDSCRGVCSRNNRPNRDDDSGSDYFSSSKTKTRKYQDYDNDFSCGKGSRGGRYSDSDDYYGGKKHSGRKDSCTNVCSRNDSYEGGDYTNSYQDDHAERGGRNCDCTGFARQSSMSDETFLKQFCAGVESDRTKDIDDCSKYFFCGSCNRNYSNKMRGEPEPLRKNVKKSKNYCDDICKDVLPKTITQRDMEKLYLGGKEIKLVDNDCKRCMGDQWKCEDPVLDNITKFLADEENFSCEKKLEWKHMEKPAKKTAEQLCAESIKRKENALRKEEEKKKKYEEIRDELIQRRQNVAKKVENEQCDDINKYRIKKSFFGEKDVDENGCCETNMCELLSKLKEIREVEDVCASDIEDKSSCDSVEVQPSTCDPLVDAELLMSDSFDECLNYKVSKPSKKRRSGKKNKNKNKNHCNKGCEHVDESFDDDDDDDDYDDHQSFISKGWNGMLGTLRSYLH